MKSLPDFDPNKLASLQLKAGNMNLLTKGIISAKLGFSTGTRTSQGNAGSTSSAIIRRTAAVITADPPWTPIIAYEDGGWKAYLNFGTVNGVGASNWENKFSITAGSSPPKYYPLLTITSSLGQITGVVISMPTTNEVTTDYVTKDTPPTTFKILLGVFDFQVKRMIVTQNLQLTPTEVFKESKASPAVGSEPYSRYYRWGID